MAIIKRLASTKWCADKANWRQIHLGYVQSVKEYSLGRPKSNLVQYQEMVLGSWNSGYITKYQYKHYMQNLSHLGQSISEPQRNEVHIAWIHNFKCALFTQSHFLFLASVNLFFSVFKYHGQSRNAFCDEIFVKGFYPSYVNILSQNEFLLCPWCLNTEKHK